MSAQSCCDNVANYIWEPATNEDGWKCEVCRTRRWSPRLDRELLHEKVGSCLMWFNESNLIYISNGTEADIIRASVERRCRELDRYDQYTILQQIMADPNLAGHAEYWAEQAKAAITETEAR